MERKSFIFHKEWAEALKKLPKDVRVEVYDAIIEFGLSGTTSAALKPVAEALFTAFRARLEADRMKYEAKCSALRESGRKGGLAKATKSYQMLANAKGGLANAYIDNDNDNDNVLSNDNINIDKSNDLSHCEKIAGGASASKKSESLPAGFVAFWAVYPRKRRVAKHTCLQKWKLHKFEAIAERIIADVRRQSESEQWTKDDGRFVPMPSTYLNQRRWEDSAIDSPSSQNGRQIGGVLFEGRLFSELSEVEKTRELERRRIVRLIAAGLTDDKLLSGIDIAAFSEANATDIEEAKTDPRTPLGWQPRKDRLYHED